MVQRDLATGDGVNPHPRKLTARAVGMMKSRLAAGETQRSVADDYGVSQMMAWKIAHEKAWKRVGKR